MKKLRVGALGLLLLLATFPIAPLANAVTNPIGNFDLAIPDRYDFHTWTWSVSPCTTGVPPPDCIIVLGIARPIARAFNYSGEVHLVAGRYTLIVDDPFGLRCGNVYYGTTVPTRDVYSWDATTLQGTLVSTFDSGCDGAPGTLTYPISLSRM